MLGFRGASLDRALGGDGLAAVEALIPGGAFCFGPEPGLADEYLVPQLYAAPHSSVPRRASTECKLRNPRSSPTPHSRSPIRPGSLTRSEVVDQRPSATGRTWVTAFGNSGTYDHYSYGLDVSGVWAPPSVGRADGRS